MAKIPKTVLGIQTAMKAGILDFSAKTPKIFSKNTKAKASKMPSAKFIPIPPRRFIEETATAIMVKMKAETGMLYFLYNTTRYTLIFAEPRWRYFSIKSVSSNNDKVSATYTVGVKSSNSKLKLAIFLSLLSITSSNSPTVLLV